MERTIRNSKSLSIFSSKRLDKRAGIWHNSRPRREGGSFRDGDKVDESGEAR